MTQTKHIRFHHAGSTTIPASAKEIFPLLCPVREYEWVPNWQGKLIFSNSGLVETDCIFTTDHPQDGPAVWVTVNHDEARHQVEFIRFSPGIRIVRMALRVEQLQGTESRLHIAYTWTALGLTGQREISGFIASKGNELQHNIDHLGKLLGHFLTHGSMLE